jgi:hypothetical protein
LRIALLLLCLAASTTQSWVAQLHFHGDALAAAAATTPGNDTQAIPVGDDSAPGYPGHPDGQCLLCQVASQGPAILLAAAPPGPVATPLVSIRLPATVLAQGNYDSRSHHWSSRGPPRA